MAAALLVWLPGPAARAQVKPGSGDLTREAIEVAATPMKGFSRTSDAATFGKLTFRGGLVLSSGNKHFGGWSGLEISPDGRKLVAVSDAGAWLTAELEYDGSAPKGIRNARIGPLLAKGGKPLPRERDRDAEAVRLIDGALDKGSVLIAFEQNHRIGKFDIDGKGVHAPSGYLALPPELKQFKRNKAIESLAVLKGGIHKGAVVAFGEGLIDEQRRHIGWIWVRGTPQRFLVANPGEFEVTDAVSLADGSLVVLARRFGWLEGVKMRLMKLPAGDIKPGAVIEGEVLLAADMSYDIDNMEGLATHRTAAGETVLTVISDNNFNGFLQRTILLQFTLSDDPAQTAKR